jgi:hypothetical protein
VEPMTVGAVDRVQAHVDAAQTGQTRPLAIDLDVYFKGRPQRRKRPFSGDANGRTASDRGGETNESDAFESGLRPNARVAPRAAVPQWLRLC